MTPLSLILHVVLLAGLIAIAIALGRAGRRSELAHVAWILVFVKLLVPPFVEVPLLAPLEQPAPTSLDRAAPPSTTPLTPLSRGESAIVSNERSIEPHQRAAADRSHEGLDQPATPTLDEALATPMDSGTNSPATSGTTSGTAESNAATAPGPSAGTTPVAAGASTRDLVPFAWSAWILGGLVCAALYLRSLLALQAWLAAARRPSTDLQARVQRAAAALDLDRTPRVRVVDAVVPPSLWPTRPTTLVVPAGLLERLTPAELEHVLMHELAHYARRDHWVRLLEALVHVAYWWFPPLVWMRRGLRGAEETACDRAVLRAGGEPRTYADALVRTAEFLGGSPTTSSRTSLATGAVAGHSLARRLSMIMLDRPTRPTTTARIALFAAGLLALAPLVPARASNDVDLRSAIDAASVADATNADDPRADLPTAGVAGDGVAASDPGEADLDDSDLPLVTDAGDEPGRSEFENDVLESVSQLLVVGELEAARRELDAARGPDASAALDVLAGQIADQQERAFDAVRDFEVAVAKHPTYTKAWRLLGMQRLGLERYTEAAAAFRRTISLGDNAAVHYGLYGQALARSGRVAQAESAYLLAIVLDPAELQWREGLVHVLAQLGRTAEAIAVVDGVLVEDVEDAALLRLKFSLLARLGRYDEARPIAERLAERVALDANIAIFLADAELSSGDPEKGLAYYVRAAWMDSRLASDALDRAILVAQARHQPRAVALLSDLRAQMPLFSPVLTVHGYDRIELAGRHVDFDGLPALLDTVFDERAERDEDFAADLTVFAEARFDSAFVERIIGAVERSGWNLISYGTFEGSLPNRAFGPTIEPHPLHFAVEADGAIVHRGRDIGLNGIESVVEAQLEADEIRITVRAAEGANEDRVSAVVERISLIGNAKITMVRVDRPDRDSKLQPRSTEQDARLLYLARPLLTAALRTQAPATVVVLYTVDSQGHVVEPTVETSTDPRFDRVVLDALGAWRFEPAQRRSVPSDSRMRTTITFSQDGVESISSAVVGDQDPVSSGHTDD